MLQGALKISIVTRLASKSFNLIGPETLGISKVQDPTSPYDGRIPIPPLLDAQIDYMWMEKMNKLKTKVLSELKTRIMGRKRKDWYMIFLTTLVILSNLEFIYQNQNRQLERYCEKVRILKASDLSIYCLKFCLGTSSILSVYVSKHDGKMGAFGCEH